MDKLNAMQTFVRVAELGSFSQAAISLNVPKATVSAQIVRLEKSLNLKLLHRTTRKVALTQEGASYFERVKVVLQQIESIESSVMHGRQVYRGKIRVDLAGTVAREIIIPQLPQFTQRYPEIELNIGCTDRTVDLLEEGVDCAIRGGMPIDEALVARKLITTRRITCASPSYLQLHGMPKTLEDIKKHDVVNYQSPRTGKIMPLEFMVDGQKIEVFGRQKVAINDIDACLRAVLANIGIAQLPFFSVRNLIESHQLQIVLKDICTVESPLYIVYLQNRHLSGSVRAFIDWAIELFRAEEIRYQACLSACAESHP